MNKNNYNNLKQLAVGLGTGIYSIVGYSLLIAYIAVLIINFLSKKYFDKRIFKTDTPKETVTSMMHIWLIQVLNAVLFGNFGTLTLLLFKGNM